MRPPNHGDEIAEAVQVSAPGKLILIGEHAAVYGRPAIVATVGLRLVVELLPSGEAVRLILRDVGVDLRSSWPEIENYAAQSRRLWDEFALDPSSERFRSVRGDDPAHLVRIALGEAQRACGPASATPLTLSVRSEIPLACGMGSSSAAAVAILAAFLEARGGGADRDALDRLGLEVERRQHGLPSGIDHRTIIRGGVQWIERAGDVGLELRRLDIPPAVLADLTVFDTGTPRECTGEVVAAVRERVTAAPRRFETVFDEMAQSTKRLRDAWLAGDRGAQDAVAAIRDFERGLESLGVVPEPLLEIVRRVEREGGAAKISGAGALSGAGAGCLIVYHPDPARIEGLEVLQRLKRMWTTFGGPGFRCEA